MTGRYSEDELIATLFAPLAGAAALGLKDDAALLPPQLPAAARAALAALYNGTGAAGLAGVAGFTAVHC